MTRRFGLLAATLAMVGVGLWALPFAGAAEEAVQIPPPALDQAANTSGDMEVAVLAGGCFWGVQGVFQHTVGVSNAVSGYAGGDKTTADYQSVSGGRTQHAEAVKITFDPKKISYGRILQIYFSVAHDPTQLNRQGPDRGTQYRSTIFTANASQEKVAKTYIAQLNASKVYSSKIATTLESGKPFYPAEDYHQDFLTKHPNHGYIVVNDLPKIENLKRLLPDLYREQPVLVANAKS